MGQTLGERRKSSTNLKIPRGSGPFFNGYVELHPEKYQPERLSRLARQFAGRTIGIRPVVDAQLGIAALHHRVARGRGPDHRPSTAVWQLLIGFAVNDGAAREAMPDDDVLSFHSAHPFSTLTTSSTNDRNRGPTKYNLSLSAQTA